MNKEKGQGLVKYAIILVLVFVVVFCILAIIALPAIGGIALAGDWISSNWEMIKSGSPLYLAGACIAGFIILVCLGFLLRFLLGRN